MSQGKKRSMESSRGSLVKSEWETISGNLIMAEPSSQSTKTICTSFNRAPGMPILLSLTDMYEHMTILVKEMRLERLTTSRPNAQSLLKRSLHFAFVYLMKMNILTSYST